jgi:type VI secretion system protein ImpF
MRSAHNDIPLIPSILDRLIDEDPATGTESAKSRSQSLREMIQNVRRDLERLLNTRWRCVGWSPDLEELDRSLVNYGIPDIMTSDLGAELQRESFRRLVETAIRYFEPRLESASVEFTDADQPVDRTLRFRIEAMLRIEPAPEPVVFDSKLELSTGNVEVQGRNR